MPSPRYRPTFVEVDLDALARNFDRLGALAGGPSSLAPVVKADAYGHGAVPVARRLAQAGAARLAVSLVEEGVELREAGISCEILVMAGALEGGYEALCEHRLTPFVFQPRHLEGLDAAASSVGRDARVHLKVDSGMSRLGLRRDELAPFLDQLERTERVQLEGVCSHYACADDPDVATSRRQLERFLKVVHDVEGRSGPDAVRWRHLSNSAGLARMAARERAAGLNLFRPGIALYGEPPAPDLAEPLGLEQPLTWRTAIVHLATVEEGRAVSYGGTWTASRPTRLATLPLGYADGYPRALSNGASVLIRGRRAPVVGRVCMGLTMVDVTDIPGAALDDEVVLVGRQGDEQVTAGELAERTGTIAYEILARIGPRVPRAYVEAGSSR